MAQKLITSTKLKYNVASDLPTTVAATAVSDGCVIDYTAKDDGRILLIIENSGATEFTAKILKGNGLQGVEDLSITIGANASKVITIESGKFVNVSGANKGKVIINGSTNLKVAAIELP